MRVITVWQPWASLILIGAKPYEFRPKQYCDYVNPPSEGERIGIHAGARAVRKHEVDDLIVRLETAKPAVSPCLHREPALTLLRRIRAGLAKGQSSLFAQSAVEPFYAPRSCIVCTAVIGAPKRGDLCAQEFGKHYGNDSDRGETFNWGWPLTDIKPVLPHVEARGMQGFWHWQEAA